MRTSRTDAHTHVHIHRVCTCMCAHACVQSACRQAARRHNTPDRRGSYTENRQDTRRLGICCHKCVLAHTHACSHAHTLPHTHTHTQMHTCMHTRKHTCMHAHTQACIHACTRACTRASTETCKYTWYKCDQRPRTLNPHAPPNVKHARTSPYTSHAGAGACRGRH